MRTTLNLDDDVAAAIEHLRGTKAIGLSEAVNELIRLGLRVQSPQRPFRQRTQPIGVRVDVSDVADALELLEGPPAR